MTYWSIISKWMVFNFIDFLTKYNKMNSIHKGGQKYEQWKKPNLFHQNRKLAQLRVIQRYSYPKHFMITSGSLSDPEDSMSCVSSDPGEEVSCVTSEKHERPATRDSFSDDMDLDFMMPSRVREILRSEGVSKDVIDGSVRRGEKKHRKAMYFTVQLQK